MKAIMNMIQMMMMKMMILNTLKLKKSQKINSGKKKLKA